MGLKSGLEHLYPLGHIPFRVGNWSGPRALGAWTSRGLCPLGARGDISGTVFFMYPYVFVAGPNKYDALLIIACADGTRNSTFRRQRRLGR